MASNMPIPSFDMLCFMKFSFILESSLDIFTLPKNSKNSFAFCVFAMIVICLFLLYIFSI